MELSMDMSIGGPFTYRNSGSCIILCTTTYVLHDCDGRGKKCLRLTSCDTVHLGMETDVGAFLQYRKDSFSESMQLDDPRL